MRVRNVKDKEEIINNSHYVILEPSKYQEKWHQLFNNNHPIYLEIGMGKGNFIIENAKKYPNINFIGLEKNASVLTYAIKKVEDYNLDNLKFVCFDASKIDEIFNKEIDKLYLNFSDPWPKKRHAKRRLTSEVFLNLYTNIFAKDNLIELKTDNQSLFEYSLMTMTQKGYDILDISLDLAYRDDFENILTEYEEKFMKKNNKIYYVKMLKHVNF